MTVALRTRITERVPPLSDRDFRRFLLGYATSMLGTQMASVALAFAVLAGGGGGVGLGAVMAARILPLVLVLLVGGAAADRLGSRVVMVSADLLRCAAQASLALLFALGLGHRLWPVLLLAALSGIGEAAFLPSLQALVPSLAADGQLTQVNSLLSTVRSAAAVAGPALAGLCVALAGPAAVLAFDAATYGVSVYAVWRLPVRRPTALPGDTRPGLPAQLREGWRQFRGRTWLWTTALQFCLFNFLVWAPFLVLGPLLAQQRLGGAGAWGAVMACYGGGAVLGGLALLGRHPGRPLFWSVVASLGWALPPAALALACPTPVVCGAALLAGVGSSLCGSLYATVTQRQIPPEVRGRVSSWTSLGAFALGPLGLAAAGPVAALSSARDVLAFGALWQVATVALVAMLPSVRREPVATPATAPAEPDHCPD